MSRMRFEVLVGLGLIIMLLSVSPAFSAGMAAQSPIDRAFSQQPSAAQLERGQTNDEYGVLTLHGRAGMSDREKGNVAPEPPTGYFSTANEPTAAQLERGQTVDQYGALTLHNRAGF